MRLSPEVAGVKGTLRTLGEQPLDWEWLTGMFWPLTDLREGRCIKKKKVVWPKVCKSSTWSAFVLWQAGCQMYSQRFTSIRKTFLSDKWYCSTKAKTWKTVCLSCFSKSRWPAGHAVFSSFTGPADSGSGAKLPSAIIHIVKGLSRWPPTPATQHTPVSFPWADMFWHICIFRCLIPFL